MTERERSGYENEVEEALRAVLRPETPDLRARIRQTLQAGAPRPRVRVVEVALGLAIAAAACLTFALLLRSREVRAPLPQVVETPPRQTPADDAELAAKVNALIADLEAEDFERRETAQRGLRALGAKAIPFLDARLDNHHLKTTPEMRDRLRRACREIAEDQRTATKISTEKEIEEIMKKGGKGFVLPDENILKRLSTPSKLDFVKTPMKTVLKKVEEESGVPILLADSVPEDSAGYMTARGTFDDLIAMASIYLGCDYVVRGPCVIVAPTSTVARLRLCEEIVDLAGAPAWTTEETQNLVELLKIYPLRRVRRFIKDGYQNALIAHVTVSGPGKLSLQAEDWAFDLVREFARCFNAGPVPAPPKLSERHIELEKAMETEISMTASPVPLSAFLEQMAKETKQKYVVHLRCLPDGRMYYGEENVKGMTSPRLNEGGPTEPEPKVQLDGVAGFSSLGAIRAPAREFMLHICRTKKYVFSFGPHMRLWTFTVPDKFNGMDTEPAIFDLRPALQGGVSERDLMAILNSLVREACLSVRTTPLRGRWAVEVDPWTSRRIQTAIDDAVRTGKVSAPPPAPWFFQTFPKR